MATDMPNKSSLSTSELVRRAACGDELAFSGLTARHYRAAVYFAATVLQNTEAAQDVVDAALLRLYRRRHWLKHGEQFATWLQRGVMRACMQRLQSTETATHQHERQHSEASQEAETGLNGLANVTPVARAVWVLAELECLSYRRIAVTLRLRETVVRRLLLEARRAHAESNSAKSTPRVAPAGRRGARKKHDGSV